MITLPMPFRLKHVNVFAFVEAEGFTLVDTGPDLPGVFPVLEASLARIDMGVEDCRRILITHYHPDHCGLAGAIAHRSDAAVWLPEIEYRTIRDHAHQENRDARLRRFCLEQGFDRETLESVMDALSGFRKPTTPFAAAGFIKDGCQLKVGGRVIRVIATPGHSRGHVSLHLPEQRLLIAGDHVLPHITPNLSPDLAAPAFHPLESFLCSLARVEELPVAMVFPAHGRPFPDLKERVAEMREHHRERSARTLEALAEQERSCSDVSRFIFGENLPPFDRLLALNETYVHLIDLESRSLVRRRMQGAVCLFERTDS